MDLFLPFNAVNRDRLHTAEDIAAMYASVMTNGVHPSPDDSLKVVEAAEGGMQVALLPGRCVIEGRLGFNNARKLLPVLAADPAQARVDLVMLRCDYVQRLISEYVKPGTPGTGAPPAPQRDGDAYELALAQVVVPAGAAAIPAGNITDLRDNLFYCGRINSLIRVDTQQMRQEMFGDWQSWLGDRQNTWDHWFNQIKGDLSGDVAANLSNRITVVDQNAQAGIAQVRGEIGAAGKQVSLLDNDDFSVWQRMGDFDNMVSGQFFADRWKAFISGGQTYLKVTRSLATDVGVQGIYSTSSVFRIVQTIEDPHKRLSGRPATVIVQTRNPELIHSVTLVRSGRQMPTSKTVVGKKVICTRDQMSAMEDSTEGTPMEVWVDFVPGTQVHFSIDRVVLMEGLHTEVPPCLHPAVNLLRCMRYYQIHNFRTSNWFYPYALTGYLLPVPMRIKPAVLSKLVILPEEITKPIGEYVPQNLVEVHTDSERVHFFEMGSNFIVDPARRGYYTFVELSAEY